MKSAQQFVHIEIIAHSNAVSFFGLELHFNYLRVIKSFGIASLPDARFVAYPSSYARE